MRRRVPQQKRQLAKVLRRRSTDAERQLWRLLRSRRFADVKFAGRCRSVLGLQISYRSNVGLPSKPMADSITKVGLTSGATETLWRAAFEPFDIGTMTFLRGRKAWP